jgi:hypothetical protein
LVRISILALALLRPEAIPVKLRGLLLPLAIAASAVPAYAQPVSDRARGAARALAEDGVTALQNGDSATAIDKLERAYQIIKLPSVGLWSARALVKAGRLVDAEERYNDVTRSTQTGDVQVQAKADAAKERDELLPRLAHVTIQLDGAQPGDVAVTLDGDSVLSALVGTSQPVDPKHHVLHATRGADVVDQPFDVAEGQSTTVTLKFAAGQGAATAAATTATAATTTPAATTAATTPPPPADTGVSSGKFWNTQREIGVGVAGAGVVAGIVGGVFLLDALSKKSSAHCPGGDCQTPDGPGKLSDARSAGNIATVGGIAGLVLVGAGAAVFFTAPKGEAGPSAALTPLVLPGGGGLFTTGRF